jgi:glutathione synthase/RimK-type ligase-like ATP-grasp enzyme
MLKVLRKAKSSIGLFFKAKALLSEKSYYPEEPHKSKLHVFLDQLAFIWKYGYFEKYYYAYGFDRKSMDLKKIDKEYIVNEMAFINRIDYFNDHPVNEANEKIINPLEDIPLNETRSGRCIIDDKYYFYLFLQNLHIPTPKVLFCTRKGRLLYSLDGNYNDGIAGILKKNMDAFAKPMGGQLGDGAFSIRIEGTSVYVDNQLQTQTDNLVQTFTQTNYLIQERITQHPQMSKLCSTAVNTIRLLTLITPNDEVIAFRAGLRIGREGSNVDNCAKGGIFVGIDMNTGKLMKRGIIKPPYGNVVFQHPDNGTVFDGFKIPYFKEAVEMAKKLHLNLYRIHSVGWDIAITQDGPIFIEGNSRWEASGTQSAVGGIKFIEKYFKK